MNGEIVSDFLITVVIPTRNRKDKVDRCISSVIKSLIHCEIIVIDDYSDDETFNFIRCRYPQVQVVRTHERRFGFFCKNLGALRAKGKYLFFLDDDNVIDEKTVKNLFEAISIDDTIAVAMPIVYYLEEPKKQWMSYIRYIPPGVTLVRNVLFKKPTLTNVFHNAYMIRKDVFFNFGGFNHLDFPIHLSELELSLRLKRKGYRYLLVPSAKTWHDIPLKSTTVMEHIDQRRAFYHLRNRVILSMYFGFFGFIGFTTTILPELFIFYVINCLRSQRKDLIKPLFDGIIDGIFVSLSFKKAKKNVINYLSLVGDSF